MIRPFFGRRGDVKLSSMLRKNAKYNLAAESSMKQIAIIVAG
jgi:hypothetical protein